MGMGTWLYKNIHKATVNCNSLNKLWRKIVGARDSQIIVQVTDHKGYRKLVNMFFDKMVAGSLANCILRLPDKRVSIACGSLEDKDG